MSVFDDIAAQVALLLASPAVQVKFHTAALAAESDLEDLREVVTSVLEIKCPPSIAASVAIGDQLNVYWQAEGRAGEEPVAGEFFLRSVLLFGGESELNPTFLSKRYDDVDLRNTRVFDYYAYNGGPIHALFPVVDDVLEDRVLIFNEKTVLTTSLDYMSYLQQLRLTRGLLFWQYLFCEKARLAPYELAALERGLTFLEQTFADDDYSDLNRRLRRLRG